VSTTIQLSSPRFSSPFLLLISHHLISSISSSPSPCILSLLLPPYISILSLLPSLHCLSFNSSSTPLSSFHLFIAYLLILPLLPSLHSKLNFISLFICIFFFVQNGLTALKAASVHVKIAELLTMWIKVRKAASK
jgi:hypothetical protein